MNLLNFLNPFNEVFETKKSLNARTLRTGFWGKMADTYFFFAGSFFDKSRNHLGLFDYLTLGIPYGLGKALDSLATSPWAAVPLFIINIPLAIVRYASAALFALLAAPIVGLIHIGSNIAGRHLREKVSSVEITLDPNRKKRKEEERQQKEEFKKRGINVITVETDNEQEVEKEPIKTTLGEHLKSEKLRFDELKADYIYDSTDKSLRLDFHRIPSGASSDLVCVCCMNGGISDHVIFSTSIAMDGQDPEQEKKLKALLKLNVGRLAHRADKKHHFNFFASFFRAKTADEKTQLLEKQENITSYKTAAPK